ncbi:MAG: CHRD domain-containing protein [Telluria sp.]
MKHSLSILALAASLALAPAAAQAQADSIRAVASGPLELPPNESPGSSVATFEFDGNILRAEIPFRDLLADTTVAHIHCCTSAEFTGSAPPAITMVDFPLGVRGGTYSHAFDLTDASVWEPAFLSAFGGTPASATAAMLDAIEGHTAYLNIHTTQFPAGEIKGWLVAAPIPEPATWGMLGFGLAGLGMMARRRAMAAPAV